MNKVTFNSYVSEDCHHFLKVEAAQQRKTLKMHIRDILENYYETRKEEGISAKIELVLPSNRTKTKTTTKTLRRQ